MPRILNLQQSNPESSKSLLALHASTAGLGRRPDYLFRGAEVLLTDEPSRGAGTSRPIKKNESALQQRDAAINPRSLTSRSVSFSERSINTTPSGAAGAKRSGGSRWQKRGNKIIDGREN